MRLLTSYELDLVAGGAMTGSTNGTGGGDDGGSGGSTGGGSTGGGSTMPPLTTPMLWQGALENLQQFFDQAENSINNYEPRQGDQNSNYDDDRADYGPFSSMFMEMWGFLPSVQRNPAAHYWDYLTENVDPEFLFETSSVSGVSAQFSGGNVAITSMPGSSDSNIMLYNVNGLLLRGVWHDAPPSGNADEIEVNGGHWTFDFIGLASDGMPAAPPPLAPSSAGTPAPDPLVKAAAQQVEILSKVDALLAANGGHFLISYKTSSGAMDTIDLAEFRPILARYSIVGSDENFGPTTGGAGQVVKLADGSYRTTIENDDLAKYSSSPALLNFLIIHEVSHNLAKALSYTQSMYDGWKSSGGTDQNYTGTNGTNGSPALYRSEAYVNNIAKSIAIALGLPVAPEGSIGGGYSYSGKFYSAP